jgi:hypothetical protein
MRKHLFVGLVSGIIGALVTTIDRFDINFWWVFILIGGLYGLMGGFFGNLVSKKPIKKSGEIQNAYFLSIAIGFFLSLFLFPITGILLYYLILLPYF